MCSRKKKSYRILGRKPWNGVNSSRAFFPISSGLIFLVPVPGLLCYDPSLQDLKIILTFPVSTQHSRTITKNISLSSHPCKSKNNNHVIFITIIKNKQQEDLVSDYILCFEVSKFIFRNFQETFGPTRSTSTYGKQILIF